MTRTGALIGGKGRSARSIPLSSADIRQGYKLQIDALPQQTRENMQRKRHNEPSGKIRTRLSLVA